MAPSRPWLPVLLHTAFGHFEGAVDPEATNFRAEKSVA
jgi:predicted sulfurtransferase